MQFLYHKEGKQFKIRRSIQGKEGNPAIGGRRKGKFLTDLRRRGTTVARNFLQEDWGRVWRA